MNPALSKLEKYIRLEKERGYDNRAVVGGLQRMLEPWRAEAIETGLPESVIDIVVSRLRDYPHLSAQSRMEALSGLLHRLRADFPDLPITEPTEQEKPVQAATAGAEEVAAPVPEADEIGETPVPEDASPDIPTTPAAAQDAPADSRTGKKPQAETPAPVKKPAPAALNASITTIPGIGPKSAKTLGKLGLQTLGDLLWHLPRRYDDYSQLKTINRLWYGEEVTIIGTVEDIQLRDVRRGQMKLTEAIISDGTGNLKVTWFNQPWIADRLKPGRPLVLSGKVDQYLGRLTMNSPEWELLERKQLHTNRIVPVYPLTAGVTSKWLRRVIHSVVTRLASRVSDPLPESVRESASLMTLDQALEQIHFPDDWEKLKQAQHRLAFDEMFMLQLGVLAQKREWDLLESAPLIVGDDWITAFLSALPYELTTAQRRALEDIRTDLAAAHPMNRLLQGDVGSGKTVVAAAAIGIAAQTGAQSAVMAPTSILAEQHHQTLCAILPVAAGIAQDEIALLLGATPEAEKENLRQALAEGRIKVIIGTHALIEDPVTFSRLGLVVIDEQHRFGVEQRSKLRQKGDNPNLLVMTATPIPRSLALTLYGDLELSVIDEMPPGRIPTETNVLRPKERSRAHQFILNQLSEGHQAFIIYPLVEGSEKVQTKAAVEEHEKLQEEVFINHNVGLLHGRLRPDEKEETMSRFRARELDVLVSTSVVEVGVDVPAATVMLIEGANRFGLAQLHQFRGRVGRGQDQSYCLLIPDSDDETDNQRLAAMEATTDGFKLAELDLEQRGPGDFLGTRQSGIPALHTAQITDVRLIEKARRHAKALFESDPALEKEEHALLAQEMKRYWASGKGEMS